MSVKACYTPTDSSMTFTGQHAEMIQQEDIFRLYAMLFNLLIKMHTKGSHSSQRSAHCIVSQDQSWVYSKDL